MKKLLKGSIIRTITILGIVSLAFYGGSCQDVLNTILQPPPADLEGDWQLIYNAGTTNDICRGELVNFPSTTGGVARLQCPGGTAIDRNYTVTGTTLEYTQTGTTYEIAFTQNNELVLDGSATNGRVLYYAAVVTGSVSDTPEKNKENKADSKSSTLNSSETK
jgi:hypothetical protein